MTNISEAIVNIVKYRDYSIKQMYTGRNRANSVGDALEKYIKDAFAGTLGSEHSEEDKLNIYSEKFSWLGSQNNPPDIMIKGGDAIEVKKTQSANSSLALNSSYPKADLRSSSPMITNECRACEDWDIKNLIYCVGHTDDSELKSLWMVYGSIYAAKQETYERIKNTISDGIKEVPDVVFSETKELGRVNKVDPLGITNLRIRGMWQIENPRKVFDYLHIQGNSKFELVCIIPITDYYKLSDSSRTSLESLNIDGFTIEDKKVKDPNNPAKLIECKLIKFFI
ncbi:NgoPII family restriction endonuclease [Francisella philomiragia]|uniref:NgoPII family restriction endonuclease n=1 Tax=Francisella philomiragia TaxID=28110 RepID=A0ABS1GAB8_9GAMM|nr:NgoPII family restriction endonuclease [Francisella philomiragia]MBK2258062.1 NgoPII family restriction endonuclease [Francisella philomiragia]MBK2301753.1 NgoPII family restriction endonuclease [Francisella philomiragia]